MSEWEEVYLTEAFSIGSGLSKPASEFGSGFPFLSFKEVFNHFFVPEELSELVESSHQERDKCSIKKGDIFLTRTSETVKELGMSCVALKDYRNATFNGFTKRLRPNGTFDIVPEYAGYYFRSSKFRSEVTALSSASTRASLNNEMLGRLKITLPSKEEQNDIAAVLICLDRSISNLRRQNETLEAIAQTLFKHWFIDFEFPNADGKPYKSSGGEMERSELGEIPTGWRFSTLGDEFDISIGRTPPRKESEWFSTDDQDIKWISIKDMGSCGAYIFETSEYLTREAVARFNIPIIPRDTVILSFKLTVGRVAITSEEMLSNEAIAHLKISPEGPFSKYIYLFLSQFNFDKLGSTSSIATAVNSKSIKALEFLVPDPKVMSNFSQVISPVFIKLRVNAQQIQTLTQTRDVLLPKLMSGKLRVTP